ncbi:SRPBCC family protein [Bacillus sp. 2205SS5-2]|uniref:SRPBCC family protein n=1 Tax=Bacillus sp. 2205SS5-2 TaxID=3109031 RepID=UPI003005E418
MPEFQDTVTIDHPLEKVFAFACDVRNGQKFMKNVVRCEKLTEGPIGKGTKFNETRIIGNREASSIIEISEFTPNQSYSAQSETKGLCAKYHYQFKEIGSTTQVSFQCDIFTKGLIMKLAKPMFVKIMKKEDGDHLQRLKHELEQ